jgi:hypothetical protein
MNYFLIVLVLGMAGFAYYQHNQDEQQVTDLQQQITDLQAKAKAAASEPASSSPASHPVAVIEPEIRVVAPSTRSSAIDAAANAARAASVAPPSDPNNLGTINTLDGRTYHNCKVLKVEADGVTFSHDDGITKVLYPFLPPNLQKQFDYDPQKAVQQTDAQTRYDEQQAAATNAAPTPAPAANP